ncbi:MAG: biotin/lipoyl-binding protein [Chitinophagaceae bacterium]|nr:biotin/lipoyl-binding protein [Chitinophagaceae bacterium]
MENVIQIQSAGKIKKVYVKSGQAVDKGQIMIELE